MKKIIIIIFLTLFLLTLGYVAAGPYLTVNEITHALEEKDQEKLAEYIEFPTLRENLKEQVRSRMMAAINKNKNTNPLALLGVALADTLIDSVINSWVTPAGITSLIKGKKPKPIKQKPIPKPTPTAVPREQNTTKKEKNGLLKDARYDYDSLSQFSIWIPNKNSEGETRLVLQRQGLKWRLVNIIVPKHITINKSRKT